MPAEWALGWPHLGNFGMAPNRNCEVVAAGDIIVHV
jgi:hypothetical protein